MDGNVSYADLQSIKSELSEIKKYALINAKSMLTVEEVAVYTGLSVGYIYQLTHQRMIPYYKPRGHVLYFKRTEIDEWMSRNRYSSNEEADAVALGYVVENPIRKGGRA